MTKPQAIQSAYNWAWNVQNDRKSPTMAILCAKQVVDAVEGYGNTPDACLEVLANLLREWRASKRAGFKEPIERMARMLEVHEEACQGINNLVGGAAVNRLSS